MKDMISHKAACRKAAFAARKDAHAQGLDSDANAQLLTFCKDLPSDTVIAAYMPIQTEISPLHTMKKLSARGYTLCVPVILGAGQPLEFHHWYDGCEMLAGAFGAAVPKEGNPLTPDVVITPLVAFDRMGYRLGYGGGFYDRSFEGLAAQASVQAIGFAYSAQEVMMIPRESTDYKLDAVITEQGILWF